MTKYAEIIYDTCFSEIYKKANPKDIAIKNLAALFANSQTVQGQQRQLETLKTFDFTEKIKNIKIPVTVISPEFDLYASSTEGKELAQSVGGKQIIIKDCGHAIFDEKPDQLIEIFRREYAV